ncbi:MAG: hypothetical protein ACU83V_09215 [Gammaproteobacteria bacterium]
MLRMVFEIVMALAVVLTFVMITKLGSLDKKANSDESQSDDPDP